MIEALKTAMSAAPYSYSSEDRGVLVRDGLNFLTAKHYAACEPYQRIIDGYWHGKVKADTLENIPYLPVSLFKTQKMMSVPPDAVRVVLTSSGTTGQAVSRIFMDAEASSIQQRALANSLMHVLGKKRLPMLVIDTDAVFKDPRVMSARGAGVLGIMRYGRNHVFALKSDLQPDFDAVRTFLDKLDGTPFFMFGFTYMVWINFYEQFRDAGLDLSNGILIHSGGWKKMIERAVDNMHFRSALNLAFGLKKIYNFYGMVEQIGSILLEGPQGLLYPPNFSDIIIRDPVTWEAAPLGTPGVVQVLSLLPHSYPGHSLLTEDMGVVETVDSGAGGWMGKGLKILGRVPKAELRGCSDVIAAAA